MLQLFLDSGHPEVVGWLKKQNLGGFETRARGVGLAPKKSFHG